MQKETMDSIPCDVIMNVVSFFNVKDSSRFGTSCRRMYYVTKEYPRLMIGPEFSAAASWDPHTRRHVPESVMLLEALEKIRGPPNLALAFCQDGSLQHQRHVESLMDWGERLPRDTAMLSVTSADIQVNIGETVESSSGVSLMLASCPDTQFLTFSQQGELNIANLVQSLQGATPLAEKSSVRSYWKAFVVYCCFDLPDDIDDFVDQLQRQFPDSIVIGGVCDSGHISSPQESNTHIFEVTGGVFGVAMGGNVPLRSVVSRGLGNLSQQRLFVGSIAAPPHRAEEAGHMLNEDATLAIRSVRDEEGLAVPFSSLGNLVANDMTYLGVRSSPDDNFQLVDDFEVLDNEINLFGDLDHITLSEGTEIALFALKGKSCVDDVDKCIKGVAADASRESLDVLGAIMFSCNGRGPTAGRSLLGKRMADANKFHKYFPHVPCLGFYAGGEIGPKAFASNSSEDVFRTGDATVQAFTAVFGIFVSPKNKECPNPDAMNESVENVSRFIDSRLRLCPSKRKAK